MFVEELNRVNRRLKPRNVKETMLKTDGYVYVCESSAMGDLISDCITSGVKLTGLQHGLLYGTREVAIVGMSLMTISGVRMTPDSGGGLSRSSDEVVERRWSKGLSLFGFVVNANQFILG
jgi:hypothetical protein